MATRTGKDSVQDVYTALTVIQHIISIHKTKKEEKKDETDIQIND